MILIWNGLSAVAGVMATTLEAIAEGFVPRLLADLRFVWPTSTRLLQLLALLQARRDWSGKDLASRLEVSPRTIRTDIERLRGTRLSGRRDARRGRWLPPRPRDDYAAAFA